MAWAAFIPRILKRFSSPDIPVPSAIEEYSNKGWKGLENFLGYGMTDILRSHLGLAGIPSGNYKDDFVQVEPLHSDEPTKQMRPVKRIRCSGKDPDAQLSIVIWEETGSPQSVGPLPRTSCYLSRPDQSSDAALTSLPPRQPGGVSRSRPDVIADRPGTYRSPA